MAEHLIPKDDDTDHHKQIRAQAKEPIQTTEDREYRIEEVKNAIAELIHTKPPGEDSITAEIYQKVYTTEIVGSNPTGGMNVCLL
jgi:hypothetical protein